MSTRIRILLNRICLALHESAIRPPKTSESADKSRNFLKAVSHSPTEAPAGCPNENRTNKKIESARGRWDLLPSHRALRTFFYFLHSLLTKMRESPGMGIYIRPDEKTAPNKQVNNNSNKQNKNKLEI